MRRPDADRTWFPQFGARAFRSRATEPSGGQNVKRKAIWFAVGFLLVAGAIVLYVAVTREAASARPTPTPTPTWSLIRPTPTPTPTVQAIDVLPSLLWEKESRVAGLCEVLSLNAEGRARYGICQGPDREARLTSGELETYVSLIGRYASFDYSASMPMGEFGGEVVRLRFVGRGQTVAGEAMQSSIATWAQRLRDRIVETHRREDLVAVARFQLASRLGLAVDAVHTVIAERVEWPDPCLGIPSDPPCVQVRTPGYRILLEAQGRIYEYRTDLLTLVRPYWALAATATPSPVPTPTRTATPSPTVAPTSSGPIVITDWFGEYYGNADLQGAPYLIRNDWTVQHDWGYGAPATGLPTDGFSARWTRRVRFSDGEYRFAVRADDGVRLWLAGTLVLDRWQDGYTEDSVVWRMMRGQHEVRLEYYEAGGAAQVSLDWEQVVAQPTATPEPPIYEWRAEFYDNAGLGGVPVVVRNEPHLSHDWGVGGADPNLPVDRFSARWTRRIWLNRGPYRFIARADDGVRVWVDGELLIDQWRDGGVETFEGHIWLQSAEHDLRVEYYENLGLAECHVEWEWIERYADWKGEYFPNRYLTGDPAFMRDDATIAFDWGDGSPGVYMPIDNYSVRWSRLVSLSEGRYRFWAYADDGVRYYVGGRRVIDEWRDSPGRHHHIEIDLDAGVYEVTVEYYERGGDAKVAAGWDPL